MASFWKRTLLGKDSNALPESSSAKGPPLPNQDEEPAADKLAPPPTINAYTHHSASLPPASPKRSLPTAQLPQEPPKFHIFQPQQPSQGESVVEEESEAVSNDETTPASTAAAAADGSVEHDDTGESPVPEQEIDDSYDWDSDDPDTIEESPLEEENDNDAVSQDDDVDTDTQQVVQYNSDELVVEHTSTVTSGHVEQSIVPVSTAAQDAAVLADESESGSHVDHNAHVVDEPRITPVSSPARTVISLDKQIMTTPVSSPARGTMVLHSEESTPMSPKFDFLNESVPLEKLQENAAKRRHESLTRIHHLDCQLASLQAKLAHESMDRELALRGTLDRLVYTPLQACVERFGNQLLPPDGPVHARVAKLEAARVHHTHVDFMTDAVAQHLESPREYLQKELHASLRLETYKADKRMGSMVRRFESIAGTAARRYQEEAASRRAALVCVDSIAQNAANLDEQRAKDFLETLSSLRESLKKEREERRLQDQRVMKLIVERTATLKRALLETAGSN